MSRVCMQCQGTAPFLLPSFKAKDPPPSPTRDNLKAWAPLGGIRGHQPPALLVPARRRRSGASQPVACFGAVAARHVDADRLRPNRPIKKKQGDGRATIALVNQNVAAAGGKRGPLT